MLLVSEGGFHKHIGALPSYTAALVSLCLLLGVAMLLGRGYAVGINVLQFVSVSDIAVQSFTATPFALVSVGSGTALGMLLASSKKDTAIAVAGAMANKNFFWLKILYWLLIVALTLMMLVLPVTAAAICFQFWGLLLMLGLFVWAMKRVPMRHRIAFGLYTTVALSVGFSFFLGFSATISAIYRTAKNEALLEICTDACRPGTLILRLSEVTVVTWADSHRLAVLRNDEIKAFNETFERVNRPILDVWNSTPSNP